MATSVGVGKNEGEEYLYTDDVQQPLEEFVRCNSLPQCVSVTHGSFMSPGAMIARGDVLVLRGMAPSTVTLTFADKGLGLKREMVVSPNIPYKFLVLPPKDSNPEEAGSSGRPVSMVTYPTVADLLMDCPTYFEANSTYDDPYLPGFSVKPGDRFRYVKVVVDTSNRTERLACRTESGDLVCLSLRCKGNFTVLRDHKTYTLRQLVNLARVPRRLKLAPDNKGVKESAVDDSNKNDDLRIQEIPLDFTGVILMSRPQEELESSPMGNPETSWLIPLDANLHVKSFSASDYEEPVKSRRVKSEHLKSFVNEHEHIFPVHATLFSYTAPPDTISECLLDTRDVIIHRCTHTQKIFAKDSKRDEFFTIDSSVDISFVEIPQTLTSIFEMMALPIGTEVRVLADLAADFPEPFVLHYGDVLRVTKHDSSSWKFKHSFIGDVPIIKCERVVKGGKSEKLKLPLDLEVSLVLLVDPSQLSITKVSDIFSGKANIPGGNVSVLEGHGGRYSPLPSSIHILQVLTEKELVVSPLHTTTAISPRIKTCVKIPLRHEVNLGLKRKLEFPDGYFIMPSKHHVVTVGIEKVEETDYEELCQASKLAMEYEDMEFGTGRGASEDDTRSQASSTARSAQTYGSSSNVRNAASSESQGRKRARRKDRIKRISHVLNPRNWRHHQTSEQEETTANLPPPVPPVSGIMTLSLQPHQAMDNNYILDVDYPLSQESAGQDEELEEQPYEDVTITPQALLAQRSRTLQVEKGQFLADPPVPVTGLSASLNNINQQEAGAVSETPQSEQNIAKSRVKESEGRLPQSAGESSGSSRPRQRQAKGEDSEGGRNRRRKTESHVTGLEERERRRDRLSSKGEKPSREHSNKEEPSEDELERAPQIRHTRTRSPVLPPAEGEKYSQSPDKVKEKSRHPDKVKEKSRHRQRADSDPMQESVSSSFAESFESETQRKTHSPNGPGENIRAPERRRRKQQSPDDPAQNQENVSNPERRRRKQQLPDDPAQNQENVSNPERRRRKQQSPDDPAQNQENVSNPERRRRKQQSPDDPVQNPESVSNPERWRRKQQSPDDPVQNQESVSNPERLRRKQQSPDDPAQNQENVGTPERQRRKQQSPDDPAQNQESVSNPERRRRRQDGDNPAEVLTISAPKAESTATSPQSEPGTERCQNSTIPNSQSERSQNKNGGHQSMVKLTDSPPNEQRKDLAYSTKLTSWKPETLKHVDPPGRQTKISPTSEVTIKGDMAWSPEKSANVEPTRPRRRTKAQEDTSLEKPCDLSVASVSSSSKGVSDSPPQDSQKSSPKTPEDSADKILQGKPVLPPKPIIFSRSGGSKPVNPIRLTQPVAPPRKKEIKTAAVEFGRETSI